MLKRSSMAPTKERGYLGKAGRRIAVVCLAVLLVVLALVSFTVGTYNLTPDELLATIQAYASGRVADTETSRAIAVLFSIRQIGRASCRERV